MFDDCRIKVSNTAIWVENYHKLGECSQLERPFQVYDPVYHKFNYVGIYLDEKNHRLYLPGGIDLWWVRRALGEKYYTRVENHPYKTIPNIMIKYKPRDDEQVQTLKFTAGLDEYAENVNAPQLSINLSTGKGKTYCSIATISYYKIQSMIIRIYRYIYPGHKDNHYRSYIYQTSYFYLF